MPAADRLVSELDRDAAIAARNMEFQAWMDLGLKTQALIFKYLGASKQAHVKNCDIAYRMGYIDFFLLLMGRD